MKKPIYLDYNGTTPHDPAVIKEMLPFIEDQFGNPSSTHYFGIKPKAAVIKAREQVAGLINCQPDEIIFTSGGTESNNHAIQGIAFALKDKGNHIITSQIEHPAIFEVCKYLEKFNYQTTYLPVDKFGLVNPTSLAKAIRPETILVTIMHANNEVGTIQPITKLSAIAKKHNVIMHTDAAQSVGKIPTDVNNLGVDLLSIAGHKLYASKGIGALYVNNSLNLEKYCHGAGQERGTRGGTENVPGIVGLGKACELAENGLDNSMIKTRSLCEKLHQGIISKIADTRLNGQPEKRLPNTLSISFKGLKANQILDKIQNDVAASAGAACHSGGINISHVLEAMEVPVDWAKGTIRFSLGRMTTAAQIETVINVTANAVNELRHG